MIRLLCLVSAMNAGGAETFLMKICRCLDRTKYQMDFCVNVREECLYDAEIRALGGKIYHIPSKSEDFKAFSKQLKSIVRENGYKNVMRVTSNAMGFYDLYLAKKAGAVNCIARSSNSSDGGGVKAFAAHRLGRFFFQKAVDVEIAPSDLAACYTFGKDDYSSGKVHILPNGIDFDAFRFSPDARQAVRKEFGIADEQIVLGHIGRFSDQKNHSFLIDVFAAVHKKDDRAVLMLVGEGELEEQIREKIREKGLENSVLFMGVRRDIPRVLSAFDLFLFPSRYEGMPNVVIEAQASGLPSVISGAITKQAILTDFVRQLPIDAENALHEWTECVLAYMDKTGRDSEMLLGQRKGYHLPEQYDIHQVAKTFSSFLI